MKLSNKPIKVSRPKQKPLQVRTMYVSEGGLKDLPEPVRKSLFALRDGAIDFVIQTMDDVEKVLTGGGNPETVRQACKQIKRLFTSLRGKI